MVIYGDLMSLLANLSLPSGFVQVRFRFARLALSPFPRLRFGSGCQRTRFDACQHVAHLGLRYLAVIVGLQVEPDFGGPLEVAGET